MKIRRILQVLNNQQQSVVSYCGLAIAVWAIGGQVNIWSAVCDQIRYEPPGFGSGGQADMLVTKGGVDAGVSDFANQRKAVRG